MEGATGALAPTMFKPQGREHLFAPAIFSQKIPRNNILHYTLNSMLSSFFINKILHIATENVNKQQTHRPILPMRDDKACLCHKQDGKLLRVL